jgi:hypothetical protein
MGAIRPTSTVDIVRAIGVIDDLTREPGAAAAIEAGGQVLATRDDLLHVRRVICGLRDQIKEAVTMAAHVFEHRLFWLDGERWVVIREAGDHDTGAARRMLDYAPNLERLWIDTHEDEVMAARAFAARFPGRKVRF